MTAQDEDMKYFSDINDNFRLFHVSSASVEESRTDEDTDLRICKSIQYHSREYPLVPINSRHTKYVQSFTNLESGMRLPVLQCGFAGCDWTYDFSVIHHFAF